MNRSSNNTRRCTNCGDRGHASRSCPIADVRLCFRCKQRGHIQSDCPQPQPSRERNRGSSSRRCYQCQSTEHVITDCPSIQCHSCRAFGHMVAVCPSRRCFNCRQIGHLSRECTEVKAPHQARGRNGGHSRSTEWTVPEYAGSSQKIEQGLQNPVDAASEIPTPPPSDRSSPPRNRHQDPPYPPKVPRQPPEEVKRLIEAGNSAFRDYDFKIALCKYDQAIALFNDDASAFEMRGLTYLETKDFQGAMNDFQRVMALLGEDNTGADTLTRLSRAYYSLGLNVPAIHYARCAVAKDQNYEPARAALKKANALQSTINDCKSAMAKGSWRLAKSSVDTCIALLTALGATIPDEWICWSIDIQIVRGEWQDAAKQVERELSSRARSVDLMSRKALLLFLSGGLDESAKVLIEVLKLDPDSSSARSLRIRVKDVKRLKAQGNRHFADQEWDAAVQSYTASLNIVTDNVLEGRGGLLRAILLSNRSATLIKLDRCKEAMADIHTSLELRPAYAKALRTRARLHILDENYQAAIDDLKLALEDSSSRVDRQSLEDDLQDAEALLELEQNCPKNYYLILGVSVTCSAIELKKAYRQLCLVHHPDKGGNEEKFKRILEAYNTLSDPLERIKYDSEIRHSSSYDDDTSDSFDSWY